MSEFVKIIGIGFLTLVAYLIVKPMKPELAIFICLVGSCFILIFSVGKLENVILSISALVEKTGINSALFSSVLKIVGIGYLTEFAYGICNDSGCTAIGDKIVLAGKLTILVMSLPIVTSLLEIIIELLP